MHQTNYYLANTFPCDKRYNPLMDFHASAMIVFANLTGANIVVYNIELNTKNIVQIKIVIGETSEQFRRHRSYYQSKSK